MKMVKMYKIKGHTKTLAISVALALSTFAGVSTANADPSWDARLALSFAPQENETDNRFEQFNLDEGSELHGSYDDAHELNDAWLGMPVRDTSGKVVGYVDDAFVDEEGYLTELIVSLNGSSVTVYVDQANVEYTEVGVLVDMPVQSIAGLERVGS